MQLNMRHNNKHPTDLEPRDTNFFNQIILPLFKLIIYIKCTLIDNYFMLRLNTNVIVPQTIVHSNLILFRLNSFSFDKCDIS